MKTTTLLLPLFLFVLPIVVLIVATALRRETLFQPMSIGIRERWERLQTYVYVGYAIYFLVFLSSVFYALHQFGVSTGWLVFSGFIGAVVFWFIVRQSKELGRRVEERQAALPKQEDSDLARLNAIVDIQSEYLDNALEWAPSIALSIAVVVVIVLLLAGALSLISTWS